MANCHTEFTIDAAGLASCYRTRCAGTIVRSEAGGAHMKTPRVAAWTIRKSPTNNYRVILKDELGYFWSCDFWSFPSEQTILKSWQDFKAWRRHTEKP